MLSEPITLHCRGTQHGNADGLSRRPIEVSGDDHTDSARVAAISRGPVSQKSATFDSQKAAAFLYRRLPTVDEIGVGDAEVYCEEAADFAHAQPVAQVLPTTGLSEDSASESICASMVCKANELSDAEIYSEDAPVQSDNPTVQTVKAITKEKGDVSGLAGGNLADEQIKDKEIGALVAMRLCSATAPSSDEVQTESELTKKLLLGWDDLVS